MLKITATLYHTLFVSPTHGTKYSVIVYVYPQVARPIKYIIENDFQFRIGNQRPRFFFFCYLVLHHIPSYYTPYWLAHTPYVWRSAYLGTLFHASWKTILLHARPSSRKQKTLPRPYVYQRFVGKTRDVYDSSSNNRTCGGDVR